MAPTVLTFKFGTKTHEFQYDTGGSNCCAVLRKFKGSEKLAEYICTGNTMNFNNEADFNNAIKFFNDIDKAGNNNGIIETTDILLMIENEDENDSDGIKGHNYETVGAYHSRPQKDGCVFDLEM